MLGWSGTGWNEPGWTEEKWANFKSNAMLLSCFQGRRKKQIFCFFLCYHRRAWKQMSFHWYLLAISGNKKKKRNRNEYLFYPLRKGVETTLQLCAQHINISVMNMESIVKITAIDFGSWMFNCNCEAHLQRDCSSASHMYACTRIRAGLRQHQTAFDRPHPFSANKNARAPTSPCDVWFHSL